MIKIALLETIEALVSAIKSKFLTKTEAESIYQPKASAINTGNIGSQSVNYAYEAYMADKADELLGHATFSTSFPSQGQGLLRYYISASNYDGQPPADGAILYMGATGGNGKDHQVAFCDDGELYIKHMIDGTWQPWNRIAKASEIPDVSGFATEDWVKRHYYDFEEMGNLFYTMDDVDSKLADYPKKSGDTMTGLFNMKDIVLKNGAIYAGSTSSYIIRYDTDRDGKQTHTFGSGAERVCLGDWFYVDRMVCHYEGNMELNGRLAVGGIYLTFDTSTNTLNFSGGDGQTVHIAVNGNVIA